MIKLKMSEGFRTTEFFLTILGTLVLFIGALKFEDRFALYGTILLPALYIYSRTHVKSTGIKSKEVKIDNITVTKR